MSNSSMVSVTLISPNKTSPRKSKIDTITIHCMAGQLTARRCGELFQNPGRKASSNYGIGPNGEIGLYVNESDMAWTSSNSANDHRAVTIEVASDSTHPYAVKDAAYNALIRLCADICKRNGIKKLVWSNNRDDRVYHRNGVNMTCHRDYKAKACPGDWIYQREGEIAAKVNAILAGDKSTPVVAPYTATVVPNGGELIRVIDETGLNIRSGPGTQYEVVGVCNFNIMYTITAYSGSWGRLKSGKGWINCNPKYVEKVNKVTEGLTSNSSVPSVDSARIGSDGLPIFLVDKNYTLATELKVRKGPSTTFAAKAYNELTDAAKKFDKDKDGSLDAGTVVTCLEVRKVDKDQIWIRIPSGWVAAYYKGSRNVK